MKSKRTIKGGSLVLSVLLLLVGCTNEITQPGARSDGKARVNFDVPGIAEEVTTRAVLAENTTVRVVAYRAGETTYCGSQAYYTDASGKLKPCTVNADGSFKAVDTENELALLPDTYDFYAYTPALPLSADYKSVTVPNSVDYASSVKTGVSITTDMTLTLTELARKCSKIALVVKKADDNTAMTTLSVASSGVTISALPTSQNVALNKDITPAAGTTTLNVPATAFTLTETTSTAITYLLPRLGTDRMKVDYNLTYTVSGTTETKPVSGTMGNIVLEKGKSYTFTLTMRKTGASLSVTDWIENNQEVVVGQSLDYTDNGKPWFLIAGGDAKNPVNGTETMNWYQANGVVDATNPDGKKACPAGWRVPTRDEMLLIWIYKPGIANHNISSNIAYFCSTEYSSTNSYNVGCGVGFVALPSNTDQLLIRCIRDMTQSVTKYPYLVDNGSGKKNVIVSRDIDGGVNHLSIHSDWVGTTPVHNEQDKENGVAAKFEVYETDNAASVSWLDAQTKCPMGWRIPTQRELQLMGVMKDKTQGINALLGFYWSSTQSKSSPNNYYYYNIPSHTSSTSPTGLFNVRCVRDVDLAAASTLTADYVQWGNSFTKSVAFNSMSGSVSVKSIDNSGADKNWLTSAVVSGTGTNGHIQITYKPTAGNAGVHNDVVITLINQAGSTQTITVKYDNGFIPSAVLSANGWTTNLPTNGVQIAKKGNKLPSAIADANYDNELMQWSSVLIGVSAAKEQGYGKGGANTDAIILALNTTATAANKCRSLGSAWYLPTINELIVIQKSLSYLGTSYSYNKASETYYWSSSEQSNAEISALRIPMNVTSSAGSTNTKTDKNYVRAVMNL